jgi:eukaryotic-like serine/threonine-protein kinase
VYAVSAATGNVVWRHHTGGSIKTSPATDGTSGGTVYVTCEDGFIYALDSKGGTQTVPPSVE